MHDRDTSLTIPDLFAGFRVVPVGITRLSCYNVFLILIF
ncbi:hypothetical protein KKH3_31800 [Pectobacterium actinidiae]|nr:hypothetical protein KKH3_31800 [Pectobacterium actinidiae]